MSLQTDSGSAKANGLETGSPPLSPNGVQMARAKLHARTGLTPRQAQLAGFLRDLHATVTRESAADPAYNTHFSSEAEARFAWRLNGLGRGRRRSFPGDRHEPRQRSTRSNNIFQRVKSALRVEDLAGRFTTLRMISAGKMRGLCPVHDERTPSFRLDLERQTWRCFGACARGGDVIDLARELMDRGRL